MGCNIERPRWQFGAQHRTTLSRTQIKRNSTSRDAGFVHYSRTSGGSMTMTEMFWTQLANQPGPKWLQQMVNLTSFSIWRHEFQKFPDKKMLGLLGRKCPAVPEFYLHENNLYISPNTSGSIKTTSCPSPLTLSFSLLGLVMNTQSPNLLLRFLSAILKFLEAKPAPSPLLRHLCHKLGSVPGAAWGIFKRVCVCLFFSHFLCQAGVILYLW